MITEKLKAKAIVQLRKRIDIDIISEELDIPVKLLEEWNSKLDHRDLVMIEANIDAVEHVCKMELLDDNKEEILKQVLEEAAIDIAKNAATPSLSADVVHAKSVQLCAEAVVKLYQTLILKGGTVNINPSNSPSASSETLNKFSNLMVD